MLSRRRTAFESTPRGEVPEAVLTEREREVLELVNVGLTNNEVAERLGITRDAVRYHLKELHSKLETGSERELLRRSRAMRVLGWIGLGAGAARLEVAAAVGIAAVALGGAGIAYVIWDRANTPPPSEVTTRACVTPVDSGPCLLTVDSGSFAGYDMTLADLARAYQTTEAELQRLNPGMGTGVITAGYEIVIPVPEGSGVQLIEPTPGARP
jgi:DNA-binding CsgD family transcriptional regulator